MKKKSIRETRFPSRRSVRMTTAEDRMSEGASCQCRAVGVRVYAPNHVRRSAHHGQNGCADHQGTTDPGGLLKHHFGMVKATELTEVTAQMSRTAGEYSGSHRSHEQPVMILKKLKRTNLQKTKTAMIGGLVDYILTQKDEDGFKKFAYSFGLNFVARTASAWKQEMIALSQETIHSKMPVTHWVMSWQENEAPARKQAKKSSGAHGLEAHQTIVAAHINTANFHVHIAVNRVHPLTEKVVQPHERALTLRRLTESLLKSNTNRAGPVTNMPAIGSTSEGTSSASSNARSPSPRPKPRTLRMPRAEKLGRAHGAGKGPCRHPACRKLA